MDASVTKAHKRLLIYAVILTKTRREDHTAREATPMAGAFHKSKFSHKSAIDYQLDKSTQRQPEAETRTRLLYYDSVVDLQQVTYYQKWR